MRRHLYQSGILSTTRDEFSSVSGDVGIHENTYGDKDPGENKRPTGGKAPKGDG
ncbi:MAG: hypothetical protein WD602_02635 [Actinomycetota bacterium]